MADPMTEQTAALLAERLRVHLLRLEGGFITEAAPLANEGQIGTWALDKATGLLYGPKTAQGWGAGLPIFGAPGRPAEFRTTATHIQWRVQGDPDWLDLMLLAALKGDKGDKGDTGADATITGVTVATGEPGSDAAVDMGGSPGERTFAFTIPRGETGLTPALSVGAVETGAPGSSADVTITGTVDEPVLNLTFPRGDKGDVGPVAAFEVGTVTTGATGSSAAATITGTAAAPILNLTLPRGATGADAVITGVTVTTGAAGSQAAVVVGGTPGARTFAFTIPRGDRGQDGDGAGDVVGPSSSNRGALAVFGDTSGKLLVQGDPAAIRAWLGISESATVSIDEVDGLPEALDDRYTKAEADVLLDGKQASLEFVPEDAAAKGQPAGYAALDGDGKVPLSQLPAIETDFDPQESLDAFIAAYEGA